MKRKNIFRWTILMLIPILFLGQDILTGASSKANAENGSKSITVTKGTNIAVTVSPDHSQIVMDLQGILWTLPMSGGKAKKVSDSYVDPSFPDWSPDGERIAFQSYQGGNYHIWSMNPGGSDMQQLTFGKYDDREPAYSPDGSKIAFSSDRGGNYDIWVLDLATNEVKVWTNAKSEEYQPTWSPDGNEIAYVDGKQIKVVDASGNIRTIITEESGTISNPSWSPEGKDIAYVVKDGLQSNLKISGKQVTNNEDVFPFPVEWLSTNEIVYTADGHIKTRKLDQEKAETIPFRAEISLNLQEYQSKEHDFDSKKQKDVKGIVAPKLSPNGKQVAFIALNDLWLLDVGNGKPRQLTDDSYMELDPTWSPDGKQIAYSSDKEGTEDIYLLDLASGKEQRLTTSDSAEFAAAWSPDGEKIAYQDEHGKTYTVNVSTGESKQVIERLNLPGPPAWGPDSKTIALAAINTFSSRFREGTNQVYVVNTKTGTKNFVDPIPFKSLSNRNNSGPVWSPDGKHIAFIIESQLWVMAVDENGQPKGEPRLVSDEIADSPSWSGDSNTLMYLSKGELKLISIDGGSSQTVPFNMKWKSELPTGKTVIHVGGLWDGVSKELKKNVDITLQGNRIVDIGPHKKEHNGKVIDASDLTVIPGLWDTHIHQQLSQSYYGSRQGRQLLSFGVTSTVSMGDYAYGAIEDREAIQSGNRVAPRYFASSELIEGSRVYYSNMRPTTSLDAVKREVERAESLDVDLLKTYVRLPNDYQAYVIDAAHKIGIPAFSHYFFPSMAFGQDGTSHISATQRLGFSRTVSPSGYAYDDVVKLAGESGMSVTSTLFANMLGFYPELLSDPRIEKLYTPSQYQSFKSEYEVASTEYQESVAKDVAILKDIIDAGGVVINGTDSPLVTMGFSTHAELMAMTEYGMTPYEALRTATYYPAKKMGVEDDLGTIEEGKIADLVFVKGNPLENIKDTVNVQMVMKDGKVYPIDDIIAPFNKQN
ncbi:DPP IV N-terminal domain-containing protein [Niallia oryzisoli]|uniref:DPP IV N-terminal domain-containing protein n=1 Tax=Niallia oryzisoli TaxID=1737571 RepID=A0ABZ2CC92_9BACI